VPECFSMKKYNTFADANLLGSAGCSPARPSKRKVGFSVHFQNTAFSKLDLVVIVARFTECLCARAPPDGWSGISGEKPFSRADFERNSTFADEMQRLPTWKNREMLHCTLPERIEDGFPLILLAIISKKLECMSGRVLKVSIFLCWRRRF
jgi:hypothetical protein